MTRLDELNKLYAQLWVIMRGWKGSHWADVYAQVAFEMLTEMSIVESLSNLDVAISRLSVALEQENFECECHPVTSQGTGGCLACKIEDKAQARIEAREYLNKKGVMHDNKSDHKPEGFDHS